MCLFQELNTHQCLNGWGKLSSVQWNMPLIKGISFFCEREKPWYMFAWQTRSCYWILQWWKVKDYTPSLYLEGKLESDRLFHLKRLTSRRPRYLRFWDEIYADERSRNASYILCKGGNIPEQLSPSPENPLLQRQTYEPSVLVQTALESHSFALSVRHSLTSRKKLKQQTINATYEDTSFKTHKYSTSLLNRIISYKRLKC